MRLCKQSRATSPELPVQSYQCGVTTINSYELLFGVHRSSTEIGENALLGPMQVWPFDKAAAEKAARLHSDLISRNQDILASKIF